MQSDGFALMCDRARQGAEGWGRTAAGLRFEADSVRTAVWKITNPTYCAKIGPKSDAVTVSASLRGAFIVLAGVRLR